MEDLNKNQVILLTLLVSFVTSIATGIMTVSLLQQAPLEVTRNINRIVEKTIETVTPVTSFIPSKEKEVTTVVVKEEDLVISSINKNLKSIVRITEKDPLLLTDSFFGIGLIISKEGLLITDRRTITANNTYIASLSDGTNVTLTPLGVDKKTNTMLFKAIQPEKNQIVFTPATLAENDVKLGQSVIGLGGDESNAVSVGRVSSLNIKTLEITNSTSTTKYISGIETDISLRDIVFGSPLFNLSGDVVGMKISDNSSKYFTPVSLIKKDIVSLTEAPKQ